MIQENFEERLEIVSTGENADDGGTCANGYARAQTHDDHSIVQVKESGHVWITHAQQFSCFEQIRRSEGDELRLASRRLLGTSLQTRRHTCGQTVMNTRDVTA